MMNIAKAVKFLLLAFSIFMFIYQASVAVMKLMNPSIVDSTEKFDIADIEPPLITICPLGQWNDSMLEQFGYSSDIHFLRGYGKLKEKFGWGAQHNLTFEELARKVLNYDLSKPDMYGNRNNLNMVVNMEIRFYPKFGYCYDLVNLTTSGEIEIGILLEYKAAQVYITDKKMRTRHGVHVTSHWGSKIILQQGWRQEYIVKVELLSDFDPRDPNSCIEYENDAYENCVDDELQKVWKPLINCNPPWLSAVDQCDEIMNISQETTASLRKNTWETIDGIRKMKTYPAKEKCTKACTIAQPNIFYGKEENKGITFSTLVLNFDDRVIYTTKKLDYGPSEFLIDMGSSLGLWFGLSVFGITDLGITALQWVKKRRIEVMKNYIR